MIKPDREPDLVLPRTESSVRISLWISEGLYMLEDDYVMQYIMTHDIDVDHDATPIEYIHILATHKNAEPLHKKLAIEYLEEIDNILLGVVSES